MAAEPLLVAAFYRFAELGDLAALQAELHRLAAAGEVRGTILLADEGVNGTICGAAAAVEAVLARLRAVPGLEKLRARFSRTPEQAFHRLKVRRKREIVSLGQEGVRPYLGSAVGTPVPPRAWDALIARPDTLVIDTRNHYEVAVGSFTGAVDPGTDHFREFPRWVEQELRPRVEREQPRALALFCTGGIRCEKATAYLLQQGFEGVHHLQGGILGYLEATPTGEGNWQGECFVFDQRVALNGRLEPGEHSLCHACGLPLTPADRQRPAYEEGVSCHHCHGRFSDADRERFAERQRQMRRARERGDTHLGG